jgi:hypothetical protein
VDVTHIVELRETPSDDVRAILERAGARRLSALTGWALPARAPWEAVTTALAAHGAEFEVFYEYFPGPDDDPAGLAAYLDLERFQPGQTYLDADQPMLVSDDTGTGLLGTAPGTEVLDSVTTGLGWAPSDLDPDLYRLADAPVLPEPVLVPRVTHLGSTSDAGQAVRSDGRELLTAANLDAVRSAGLVRAPTCIADGQVLRWRRGPVFSGRVIEQLHREDVSGLTGKAVYLGQA